VLKISTYNTLQKTLILEAVQAMDNHPTAEEIYCKVSEKCSNISRGTVYRNLNKLADDGKILRVAVANAPDRFDKTTYDHCHFRCLKCGGISDFKAVHEIDIDRYKSDDFDLTGYDILFNGFCKRCSN